MTYLLYRATNRINGKRYIGITGRTLAIRKKRHFYTAKSGYGAAFGAAIRKYGGNAFDFVILVVCPNLSYANAIERAAITILKPEYNLTAGGGGVFKYRLSDEAKAKISITQRGNTHWLGKHHSLETKIKMRAARLAFWSKRPHSRKKYVPKGAPKRGHQIICDGITYESIIHASKSCGITYSKIWEVMRRQQKTEALIEGKRFIMMRG